MTSSGNKNTPECLMCKSPVEKTDNSWRRYSLKLSGPSLEQFEGQDGFLCSSCKSKHLQQTASQTQIGRAKKRPSFSFYSTQKARKKPKYSVPHVSSSHSKVNTSQNTIPKRDELVEYVSKAIKACQYAQAIKAILNYSKGSRKAFCTVASKAVRREMSRCALKILKWSLNAGHIATFKWDKAVEEATSHMPILVNVLQGALYRHQAKKSTFCMPDQRLGFILSVILYSHRQKYNFIQSCMSLKLKRHGCSNSLFDCLHALGVCQTRTIVPSPKDMVMTDYTEKQKQWQLTLSQQLKSIATSVADDETQRTSPCSEEQAALLNETHLSVDDLDGDKGSSDMSVSADDNSDSDPVSSPVAESALAVVNVDDLVSTSSSKHYSSIEKEKQRKDQAPKVKHMPPALHNSQRLKYLDPGYIMVCDSVLVELASPRSGYKLQASTFAVRNRVGYDQSLDYTVKRAEEIPLSCFLPTSDDWEGLKQRICQILERILKDHLPFLKEVECSVSEAHQHSDALSERSQIASLGVIDKNPYSTSGSVGIVESLHQFVPSYGDETLYPIVCFGDGLSVVKMIDAKCAKASGVSAADRLEGLVQCPQDFHRRGVLLQDTMDRFFKEDSTKETGTLFQILEDFSQSSVKQKVAKNFNDVENLLNFCTHALSTMLALKLAKLDGASKTPADFPTSGRASQKKKWLTEFTEEMVDFLWPTLPSDCSLDKVCKQNKTQVCLDKKDFGDILDDMVKGTNGCKCGESSGEGMIQCFNGKCGAWFHYSCANVDGPVEGDWWCSAECQASKSYIYCKCHKKTGEEGNMIQCEMQSHCTSNEWYHAECIRGAKDLPDEWYCSPACKRLGLNQSKSDGVQEYSKALLYEGLCHLAFRDAVGEGDGPAILSHWRINTLQFWNSKHLKYFILAHNMLAGVNGFYPARVAHDMTWNRVANLTGRADGNIGLDLVKEIPTDEYWEMVSRTQDGHPEKGEQQGKLREEFLRNLEGIFLQSHTYEAKQAAQEQLKFDHDVKYFTSAYMRDGLFDFVPGRHHKSFPFFKHTVDVNCPELMGKKLLLLSQCMDSWRGVVKS